MKHLKHRWQPRLIILMSVSFTLCALLFSLELTSWAAHINDVGYSHGENEGGERTIPVALMYILPFVKELVLIGVPLLLTLLWIKVYRLLTRKKRNGN